MTGGSGTETAPSRRTIVWSTLPERAIQLLVGVFVASATMATFNVYEPYTVLPLAIVLCALSWRFLPGDLVPSVQRAKSAAIATGAIVLWVVAQIPFATQFIVATRDPGIYTNLGVQLARTGHSSIDVSAAVRAAAGIANVSGSPEVAQYEGAGSVHLQGGSGFPSLLGLGYWAGGVHGLIVVNCLLGGVALLAVFAVARRFLGPWWSILPPAILAVSMPMVYFSRGPYTEIVSLALFFGALAWLWSAFRTGSTREFVFAGILAGATSETRIDGVLGVAAMVVAFLLVVLGIARPRTPIRLGRALVAFAAPAAALTALSIVDFETNFHYYVAMLGSQTKALWALFFGVVVLTGLVLAVQATLARRRRETPAGFLLGGALGDRAAHRLGVTLGALVVATFAFWALRPLLFVSRGGNSPNVEAVVEAIQRTTGAAVDGARTYDEWSLYWFVWYFGAPFLVASGIGLALLVHRAVVRREPGLLLLTALTFGVSLLYLDKMSITPDQIWAFRRALPLIAPGLVLASVWPVRLLVRRFGGSSALRTRVIGAVCILLMVSGTVSAWSPRTFDVVVGHGQAAEIQAVCDRLGDSKRVVLVNLGRDNYSLSLATFCQVDVVMVSSGPETADSKSITVSHLKTLASRLGAGTPVLTSNASTVPWKGTGPAPFQTTTVIEWIPTLIGAPSLAAALPRRDYLGSLNADGTVSPR